MKRKIKKERATPEEARDAADIMTPEASAAFRGLIDELGIAEPARFWSFFANLSGKALHDLSAQELREILDLIVLDATGRGQQFVSLPIDIVYNLARILVVTKKTKGGQQQLFLQKVLDHLHLKFAREEKKRRQTDLAESATEAELNAAEWLSEKTGWSLNTAQRRMQKNTERE